MKIDDVVVGEVYAAKLSYGKLTPVRVLAIDRVPERTHSRWYTHSGVVERPADTRKVRRPQVELLDDQLDFERLDRVRHMAARDFVRPWPTYAEDIARKRAQEQDIEDAIERLSDVLDIPHAAGRLAGYGDAFRVETHRYGHVALYLTPDQARKLAQRVAIAKMWEEEP